MIRLKGLQFCSKQRIFDLRRNWSNNDYKIDQLFVHFCSSLFVGLSLCCGTQANLSRDEIDILVQYYQTEDGRVRYKEFCDLMENGRNDTIFQFLFGLF